MFFSWLRGQYLKESFMKNVALPKESKKVRKGFMSDIVLGDCIL